MNDYSQIGIVGIFVLLLLDRIFQWALKFRSNSTGGMHVSVKGNGQDSAGLAPTLIVAQNIERTLDRLTTQIDRLTTLVGSLAEQQAQVNAATMRTHELLQQLTPRRRGSTGGSGK